MNFSSLDKTCGIIFHPLVSPVSLKKSTLLFDNLFITLGHETRFEPEYEVVLSTYNDLDFLFDQGIIRQYLRPTVADDDPEINAAWNAMAGALKTTEKFDSESPEYYTLIQMASYAGTSASQTILEKYFGMRATPIHSTWLQHLFKPKNNTMSAIGIVLSQMPEPDESTPWESIIDFRNDRESRLKYNRLKKWINDVLVRSDKPEHIIDELKCLLSEYENYMRIHKMKINKGICETIITNIPESIENLLKLNLSKIAKGLFLYKDRKISLMEAESKAPGKEVAYILHANDNFK